MLLIYLSSTVKEGKEKLRMLRVCSIYTSITRSVSSSVFVYAYKGEINYKTRRKSKGGKGEMRNRGTVGCFSSTAGAGRGRETVAGRANSV